MKKVVVLAAAALLAVVTSPAFAQNQAGHDNGTGGSSSLGMPMMNGSTMDEDPYRVGIRMINHEKYSDAILYLNQALMDRPNNANILAYAGYAYAKLGDFSSSQADLQKALAGDPDHKKAHEFLGELDLMRHDLNSANAQAAELARICSDGCDERDDLNKAIADYQAKNGSPPATAAATPAPARH